MPGVMVTPSDRKKIEPLVMMANERSPVDPIEIGCNSAKCAETAPIVEELHVEAAGVIVVAPTSGPTLAIYPDLKMPLLESVDEMNPWFDPVGGDARSASVCANPPMAQIVEYAPCAE